MKKRKFSWKLLFNIIIAIIIIMIFAFLCLSENGLADLWKHVHEFKVEWIISGLFCQLFNIFAESYLTYRFTKHHCDNYTMAKAISSTCIGMFFSAVTPSASGGQPMQAYAMTTQGVDSGIATSVLIQKLIVYQSVLTGYSAVVLLLRFNYFSGTLGNVMRHLALFGFTIQCSIILVLLLFSFNKKLTNKLIVFVFKLLAKIKIIKKPEKHIEKLEKQLELFHVGNKDLYKNKSMMLEAYVITAMQLTFLFLIPYCVYRSFGLYGSQAIDMLCSESFTIMVSYFAPLPGASGASEGAAFIFFESLIGAETIKSLILIKRLFSYYLIIVLTAPFVVFRKGKKLKKSN